MNLLKWSVALFLFVLGCTLFVRSWYQRREHDSHYAIKAVIQTSPGKEMLPTAFLEEVLGLYADKKSNLYAFDAKEGEKKLKETPLIREAKIKKISPDTLFVDYSVRNPIALLYDYTNTGVDEEGMIFPIHPFFTPKTLPEIYLGLLPFGSVENAFGQFGAKWNEKIPGREINLAIQMVKDLSQKEFSDSFQLLRLDVSKAYCESYGQKQVVVVVNDIIRSQEEGREVTFSFPRIIRLSPEHYREEMQRYLALASQIDETFATDSTYERGKGAIVEMRIPSLAFVRFTP